MKQYFKGLPKLPSKVKLDKLKPQVVQERRAALQQYLRALLVPPVVDCYIFIMFVKEGRRGVKSLAPSPASTERGEGTRKKRKKRKKKDKKVKKEKPKPVEWARVSISSAEGSSDASPKPNRSMFLTQKRGMSADPVPSAAEVLGEVEEDGEDAEEVSDEEYGDEEFEEEVDIDKVVEEMGKNLDLEPDDYLDDAAGMDDGAEHDIEQDTEHDIEQDADLDAENGVVSESATPPVAGNVAALKDEEASTLLMKSKSRESLVIANCWDLGDVFSRTAGSKSPEANDPGESGLEDTATASASKEEDEEEDEEGPALVAKLRLRHSCQMKVKCNQAQRSKLRASMMLLPPPPSVPEPQSDPQPPSKEGEKVDPPSSPEVVARPTRASSAVPRVVTVSARKSRRPAPGRKAPST